MMMSVFTFLYLDRIIFFNSRILFLVY